MGLKALLEKKLLDSRVHVKKNDKVVVLTGRDRGKQSRVIEVDPKYGRVRVEGVAVVKDHIRPNPTRGIQGGIVEKEALINVSNVMLICPSCSKPTRIARHEEKEGRKVRSCKKCGAIIDK